MLHETIPMWARSVDAGDCSVLEGLHRMTFIAAFDDTISLRSYFEAVKKYLPLAEWHKEGEELKIPGRIPVCWQSPADFYAFADHALGSAFAIGEFIKSYAHEYDPEKAEAILKEVLSISELAKDVPVLNDSKHSGNQYTVVDKKENINKHKGGTSKEYRIAKLKRDYPEIAERLINGEFKTVAAAERAAGIGKPKMTAVEKVVKAFDRLSDEEKAEFMAMAKARQVDEKETNQKILEKIRKSGVEPYIDPKTLELFIEPDTLSEKQRAYIETHKDFIIKELCIERISQDRQFIRELYKELRNSEPVCVSKPIFSNGQLKKIRMLAHPDKHNNSSLSNEVFKMVDTALKG